MKEQTELLQSDKEIFERPTVSILKGENSKLSLRREEVKPVLYHRSFADLTWRGEPLQSDRKNK